MAYTITVEQVDRTYNSITMNVSGMLEGDRQTYILISPNVRGEKDNDYGNWTTDDWEWYTLPDAKAKGYISDYWVTDLGNNNGDIKVDIPNKFAETHKVWRFAIFNLVDGDIVADITFNAVLEYDWDYTSKKVTGEPIDITRDDMIALNLAGVQLAWWAADLTGIYYYSSSDIDYGEIYSEYLQLPAENIANGAHEINGKLTSYLNVYGYVYSSTQVTPGATFRAGYFNDIKNAINNFNMKVSVKV